LRRYTHDFEANTDPAGMVRELRTEREALLAKLGKDYRRL